MEDTEGITVTTEDLEGRVPTSDTFCASIQAKIWSDRSEKPSLYERLLAVSLDLQRLPKKGTMSFGNKSFAYHNVDDVMTFFAHVQLKYRISIKATHIEHDFNPSQKPYVVICFEIRNVDDPSQTDSWTWVDDGEDFTKAAAFALKYGLLRRFLSSDGNDEELSTGNVQSRSASVRQNESKPKVNNTAAVRQFNLADPSSKAKVDILKEFNSALNTPFGDNYVVSMLGLYETRLPKNELTDSMKASGSPFKWVYDEIKKKHLDPGECGANCAHYKPIFQRLSAVT